MLSHHHHHQSLFPIKLGQLHESCFAIPFYVAAFAISLFSLWAAGCKANPRQSYGFFRIKILGALVSIELIWLSAGILVHEAIFRIIHNTGELNGFLMFIVAAFGLVVNVIMAFLLGHDHGHGDHSQHSWWAQPGPWSHDHAHTHGMEYSHGISIAPHRSHSGHATRKDEHSHIHVKAGDCYIPLLKHSAHGCESKVGQEGSKQKQHWNINVQGAYLHVLGDSNPEHRGDDRRRS